MNGVINNIQYLPGPHGLSKRIRLHDTELHSSPIQGISQFGHPSTSKEPEFLRTTHVWVRNNQSKSERYAFHLDAGDNSQELNGFSTEGFKGATEENFLLRDLGREFFKGTSKKSCSETSNGVFKDTDVKCLKFLDQDTQNTFLNETVQPSSDSMTSNVLNAVCEESNKLTLSSMDIEETYTNATQTNSIENSTSVLGLCFKDKLSGIVEEFSNTKCIPDNSNGLSRKTKHHSGYKNGTDKTKKMKCNHHDNDILRSSCEIQYESKLIYCVKPQTDIVKYSESLKNTDECLNIVGKISRMSDFTIEKVGEYKANEKKDENCRKEEFNQNKVYTLGNIKPSNTNRKMIVIDNSLSDSHHGEFEAKEVSSIRYLDSKRVLPWEIYTKIARRLPDYKLFSNMIQRAMQKVEHHENGLCMNVDENDVETISSGENASLENTSSTVTENEAKIESGMVTEETNKIYNTRSQLDTLLYDLDEMEHFLEYANNKISEMDLSICSVEKEILVLETESEYISFALHRIRNSQHFAKSDEESCFDDTNVIIGTRKDILKSGDHLLQKMRSFKLNWEDILAAYKNNFAMVSRCMYTYCSLPFETMLYDKRDLVYDSVYHVDKIIENIEVKEETLNFQRGCKLNEFSELQIEIAKFMKMHVLFDNLCQKLFV